MMSAVMIQEMLAQDKRTVDSVWIIYKLLAFGCSVKPTVYLIYNSQALITRRNVGRLFCNYHIFGRGRVEITDKRIIYVAREM